MITPKTSVAFIDDREAWQGVRTVRKRPVSPCGGRGDEQIAGL